MIDVHLWQSLMAPDRLPSLVALDKVVDRLTIKWPTWVATQHCWVIVGLVATCFFSEHCGNRLMQPAANWWKTLWFNVVYELWQSHESKPCRWASIHATQGFLPLGAIGICILAMATAGCSATGVLQILMQLWFLSLCFHEASCYLYSIKIVFFRAEIWQFETAWSWTKVLFSTWIVFVCICDLRKQ